MDKNRLAELRQLVEKVMHASPVKREIDGYLSGKLDEVISNAKEASGRAKNKDHWISCAEQCWYVFENGVMRDLES